MRLILDFDEQLVTPVALGQRLLLTTVVHRIEEDRIDVSPYGSPPETVPGESRAYVTLEQLERKDA